MATTKSPFIRNPPSSLPDEPPRRMIATQQEMMDAQVPLRFRDFCAHLYIPLLKCRYDTHRVPWKCKAEKHEWEECEMADYYRRMRDKYRESLKIQAEEKAAAAAQVDAVE
jgi:NADH-ubiquinone oxidoreductase B18 subunit (NDUFB7).